MVHGKVKPYPKQAKQQKELQGKMGKCFRCGWEGHYAKDRDCPARNKTCRKCHKTGHFQSQCRTKGAGAGGSGQVSGIGPQPRPKSQKSRRVNAVEVDNEEDYAFVIEDSSNIREGCVNMCTGGVTLHCKMY